MLRLNMSLPPIDEMLVVEEMVEGFTTTAPPTDDTSPSDYDFAE
jgi:hypothetical protein